MLRDVFVDRLPSRVVARMTLGVARNKSRRLGQRVSPNDVTIGDLVQCTAWDLISVEGVGYQAWRLLLDELYRLGLQLEQRDPNLTKLTAAGLVVREHLADGSLDKKAAAVAREFLALQEKLVYQIDYESDQKTKM